jgi:hypothetical protein
MSDAYTGDITAYRRADGTARLEVTPGPLRVSRKLVAMAEEGESDFIAEADGVLTFFGYTDGGKPQAYRYRIVGGFVGGPEDGWTLCEPLP